MSYTAILLSESNVSRRIIYFSLYSRVQTGTPMTLGSASTCAIMRGGAAPVATANNLVISDKTNGIYSLQLNQSECSVMGSTGEMVVMAGSFASAMPTLRYVQIIAYDPGDAVRQGLSALPNANANAAGGLMTFGTGSGQINPSSGSVDAQYLDLSSKLTVGVGTIKAGTYSGVTVGSLATIPAGDYSSSVTFGVAAIKAATYSGVTVGSLATLVPTDYTSKVTVGVGGFNSGVITTTAFAAAALDNTVFSVSAEEGFADTLLGRSIQGGGNGVRSVKQALYVLRNKVDATSSTGTVYYVDDATSAWTFSATTGGSPINSMDPVT